ncbi:MAG: hypothetical protein WAO58_10175 [Fimbriimonadaceae bacterium]
MRKQVQCAVEKFIADTKAMTTLAEVEAKFGKPTYVEAPVGFSPVQIPPTVVPQFIYYSCRNGDIIILVDQYKRVLQIGTPDDIDLDRF